MPIAYKSAGAGGGTETTGAQLALACPATVDANDILVGHVIWLDNATEPTDPSGWTRLYTVSGLGAGLGTGTPTGRAYVYGKLAAGTEDGATINFGTAGGTAGRFGRIYSFSGYVSGSITDVIPAASFSDIPSDTSPQAPTVTTTVAGALAVALVSQDDNNTLDSFTGESGGDWTEALAEFFTSTIGAQGCMCQLQTATPTADPGTITGGSATTPADENSVIGFEIRPNALGGTNYTRTISESVSTTDSPIRGTKAYRQMPTDILTLADALTRARKLNRIARETRINPTDAVMRSAQMGRTTNDQASLTDRMQRAIEAFRKTNDGTEVIDSAQRLLQLIRILVDTTPVTDALIRTITEGGYLIVSRLLNDGVDISELVQRAALLNHRTTDTTTAQDNTTRGTKAYRRTEDTASTEDALARSRRMMTLVADTAGATDEMRRFIVAYRRIIDFTSADDIFASTITLAGVLIVTRLLNDGISAEDAVRRAVKMYRRESESVDARDGTWYSASVVRAVIDTLTTADNTARVLMLGRTISDPVEAADNAFRFALLDRILRDDADAQDSLSTQITYYQLLLGFVLQSLRAEPVVMALDKSDARLNIERAEPVVMEMRNL